MERKRLGRARAGLAFGIPLLASGWMATAEAQSGASDDRVSLPDGPGSIGGIGENVTVEGNMGAMALSVPFRLPEGHPRATPSLGLRYASSAGSGIAGLGWAMDVPSIERATLRGLPDYDAEDAFVADGSEQLVRVSQGGGDAVYRARYERGFVRYTWHSVGAGTAGHFTAEYPDGTVGYFGADRQGSLVQNARVTHPAGGVFRYQLVETVDPFGHRVRYDYTLSNGYPLLDTVSYLHDDAGKARFSVRFVYATRSDVLSDGKPGFELRLTQRLSSVRVFSGAEQIRQYDLAYESEAGAGGLSRLASVTERGRRGVPYPVRQAFGYSQALGGACSDDCQRPFVVDMGTLPGGIDLQAGTATLLDINGDALPDVLDTSGGTHRFFLSQPSVDGRPTLAASAFTSRSATSAFQLTNPGVQLLDLNGDGFTDMVSTRTGAALCNDGKGDWHGSDCFAGGTLDIELQDDPSEAGFGDPLRVRFFDYDNDKRIDLLRTTSTNGTDVRRDTGAGFESIDVAPLGEVFDESALSLADLNGDGLLDAVLLADTGSLRYRTYFGLGRWADWASASVAGLGQSELRTADLEDLNGDGLDDIVVVGPSAVKVLLNRSAGRFAQPLVITDADVDGTLPDRTGTTTVLYADMNGNGSEDVVWVSSSGRVQFLDLFPVKPNLLARVENGIGLVQRIRYGTSIAEMARDSRWGHPLSMAMNVVKQVDQWVTLTGTDSGGLHDVVAYDYHDAYYDGAEKQFRGFGEVEQSRLGDADDAQEPGLTVSRYDLGVTDAYRAGLLLQEDVFARDGDTEIPLQSTRTRYDECSVAERPSSGLTFPVRHVCAVERTVLRQERAPQAAWATVQTALSYDGYGNVVREASLGVVRMGPPEAPSACRPCAGEGDAACGPDCSGDELIVETSYVAPGDGTGGRWLLDAASRITTSGAGDLVAETLHYYDGQPFVGLPSGQLTRGGLTRVARRVSSDELIEASRSQLDAHGNAVVTLDPLGSAEDASAHRTRYEYDAEGLNVLASEVAVGDHALRREYSYDAAYNQVSEATGLMLVTDGAATSSRDTRRFRYDEHGRVSKIIDPGNSEAAPTFEYAYELADPVSRVVTRGRSQRDGAPDHLTYRCLDGRGRTVQTVSRIAEGRYLASGFQVLNSRGTTVRAYQPYEKPSDDCASAAPDGVAFTTIAVDPFDRAIRTTLPDAELYGAPSVERVDYTPLAVRSYDAEDTADGPHADTPTVRHLDGLGRLVAVERGLSGISAATRVLRDSLGRVAGYEDAAGHVRRQTFDLLDRVTEVDDPNTGLTRFAYDAAANRVRKETAGGDVVRQSFDGANRVLASWSEADRDGTLVSRTYDALDGCEACTGGPGMLLETRYPVVLGDDVGVGIDRRGYDARRRPVYGARSVHGHAFEIHTTYDDQNRVVATRYPDGQVLERSHDDAGRLLAIPGVLADTRYDARGERAEERLDNGTSVTFAYDARQRLSGHALRLPGDDVVFALAFSHDRVGNMTRAEGTASEGRLARAFAYAYDDWYRPISARLADGSSGAETLSFAYDAIDNVLSRTSELGATSRAHVGDFRYADGHPNAVAEVGGDTYGYSADGDLAQRGDTQLSWDYMGRLVRAEHADVTGLYGYGPGEERVVKDEDGHVVYYVSPEFEVRDGVGTLYPRIGSRRLARIESTAIATSVLTDADGDGVIGVADAVLARASGEDAELPHLLAASAKRAVLGADESITWLHQDVLRNVVAATDAAGGLIAERAFYPHGQELGSSGFVDDHGYSGQEEDEASGLVHYRFRELDPTLGRWASADPRYEVLGEPAFAQLGEATTAYAYVANQYGNAFDPTGLKKAAVSKKKAVDGKAGSLSYTGRHGRFLAGVGRIGKKWKPDLKTPEGRHDYHTSTDILADHNAGFRRVYGSALGLGLVGAVAGAIAGVVAQGFNVSSLGIGLDDGDDNRGQDPAALPPASPGEPKAGGSNGGEWQPPSFEPPPPAPIDMGTASPTPEAPPTVDVNPAALNELIQVTQRSLTTTP